MIKPCVVKSLGFAKSTAPKFKQSEFMSDKVAIVTAAGSGMGAEVARKLASLDYKVAILSSSGKGEELAGELGGVGVTGSNQNNADLEKLVAVTLDSFGRIDAVVNSARTWAQRSASRDQ